MLDEGRAMASTFSFCVVVKWLRPSEGLALGRGILERFNIRKIEHFPSRDMCIVSTREEAQKLKDHLEKTIPKRKVRIVDEANNPKVDETGNPLVHSYPVIEIEPFLPKTRPL
jgi:hypothetical protein